MSEQIKLKDITNSMCDVREYMGIQMRDEDMEEIAENYDVDYDLIENIIELCHIYVKGEHMNTEIVPVDIQKMMNSDIKVFPEELSVWLAFDYGWVRFVGNKVNICGIDFSFVVNSGNNGASIRVSTLEEGVLIKMLPLTLDELNPRVTKEEGLKLFEEKAKIIKDIIDKNGTDEVVEQARKRGAEYFEKFGERPPVEKDTFFPNLPRGTKVWSSVEKFKREVPPKERSLPTRLLRKGASK